MLLVKNVQQKSANKFIENNKIVYKSISYHFPFWKEPLLPFSPTGNVVISSLIVGFKGRVTRL